MLGLAAGNSASSDTNLMWVKQLQSEGSITEAKLSLNLPRDEAADNWVDFGTPDNSDYVTDSPTLLSSKADEEHWAIPVNGFKWSSNSDDTNEYMLSTYDNANYADIDLNEKCLGLPERELYYIESTILSNSGVEIYINEDS